MNRRNIEDLATGAGSFLFPLNPAISAITNKLNNKLPRQITDTV